MKLKDWLKLRCVTKDAYYYWLHKFQRENIDTVLQELPAQIQQPPSFVEISKPEASLPVLTEMYGEEITTYCKGVVNKKESYLCEAGEWNDLTDIHDEFKKVMFEEYAPYFDIDNFSIKAYAVPSEAKEENNEENIIPAPDSVCYNGNQKIRICSICSGEIDKTTGKCKKMR